MLDYSLQLSLSVGQMSFVFHLLARRPRFAVVGCTNAQSTPISFPNIAFPCNALMASCASVYCAYSTNAYPLHVPVCRSRFMVNFETTPYSENTSNKSSSSASTDTPVTNTIQPLTDFCGPGPPPPPPPLPLDSTCG